MHRRNFACGYGEQTKIREGESIMERCDVGKLSRQAIHRLGDHNVESQTVQVCNEFLKSRTKRAAPALSPVDVAVDYNPVLRLCVATADLDLVFDGSGTLH